MPAWWSPNRKIVDLGEMLRMHHAEMRAIIEEKGLRCHHRSTLTACRWTDPTLVLRVLRNPTENAIKFTPQGHVTPRLRVESGAR